MIAGNEMGLASHLPPPSRLPRQIARVHSRSTRMTLPWLICATSWYLGKTAEVVVVMAAGDWERIWTARATPQKTCPTRYALACIFPRLSLHVAWLGLGSHVKVHFSFPSQEKKRRAHLLPGMVLALQEGVAALSRWHPPRPVRRHCSWAGITDSGSGCSEHVPPKSLDDIPLPFSPPSLLATIFSLGPSAITQHI
nr:hypothetical protein CFP56_00571 [Quercus suber]